MDSTEKFSSHSPLIFRSLSGIALVIMLTFSGFGAIAAQDDQPTDDEVNTIAKQLYCPVCENVPLDVCGTRACAQWRASIREKLAAGWHPEQLKQYFSEQYGVRVLAEPPTKGFNNLFWALPPVVTIVGWFLVLRFIHSIRHKQPAARQPVKTQRDAEEYAARLEDELAQWR